MSKWGKIKTVGGIAYRALEARDYVEPGSVEIVTNRKPQSSTSDVATVKLEESKWAAPLAAVMQTQALDNVESLQSLRLIAQYARGQGGITSQQAAVETWKLADPILENIFELWLTYGVVTAAELVDLPVISALTKAFSGHAARFGARAVSNSGIAQQQLNKLAGRIAKEYNIAVDPGAELAALLGTVAIPVEKTLQDAERLNPDPDRVPLGARGDISGLFKGNDTLPLGNRLNDREYDALVAQVRIAYIQADKHVLRESEVQAMGLELANPSSQGLGLPAPVFAAILAEEGNGAISQAIDRFLTNMTCAKLGIAPAGSRVVGTPKQVRGELSSALGGFSDDIKVETINQIERFVNTQLTQELLSHPRQPLQGRGMPGRS